MHTASLQQNTEMSFYGNSSGRIGTLENRALIKSVKVFFLLGILLAMGTLTARTANPIDSLMQHKRVVLAMASLDKNLDWVTEQQIAITEIPAPEFHEAARGAYVGKLLGTSELNVHTNSVGNVTGERAGASSKGVVLVVAHLDTVFSAGTDVRVKH